MYCGGRWWRMGYRRWRGRVGYGPYRCRGSTLNVERCGGEGTWMRSFRSTSLARRATAICGSVRTGSLAVDAVCSSSFNLSEIESIDRLAFSARSS